MRSVDRLDSPDNAVSITPSDSTDLADSIIALSVAASGNVSVETMGGQTAVFYVAAGVQFRINARRVNATGTTAQGIVGFY